jgi:murein L,D-transpeptidase YafK
MKAFVLSICALFLFGGVLFISLQSLNTASSSPSKTQTEARLQTGTDTAPDNSLSQPIINPRLVVSKSARRLKLYSGDKLLHIYRVALGFSPVKDKLKEGDGATPEGEFYIFTKNPESAYYLSLGISYPNIEDAKRGLRTNLITAEQYQQIVEAIQNKAMPPQDTPLGGQIYIHGRGARKDWTWGCVALDDKDMKAVFDTVQVGTQVVIEH